jgi:type IV pilus assembly protein PilY1
MTRTRILSTVSIAAAGLLVLPLRSDGTPTACDNVTTSLQSTLTNPVAGDERFFTLPVGPSNVMFLVDTSGSMDNIPQCGDATSWGSNALPTCTWPTFASVSAPSSAGQVASDGTCDVASNTNLAWMLNYTPTSTLVDPGFGTASNGLVDTPSWGTGCTGNNCLFQLNAVYGYSSWNETSATPRTSPCDISFTYQDEDCTDPTNPKSVNRTFTGTIPGCSACLTDANARGFFFYKNWIAAYQTRDVQGSGGNRHCTGSTTTRTQSGGGTNTVLFSGGWLNANPPKFMSARKVIKNSAWIDPNVTKSTDQLRIGLSYLSTNITNGAAIVVPVGPSAADSFPINASKFVEARQLILNALNHRNWPSNVTLPSLASGGTPLATALFHVGQYFSQPSVVYTTKFGGSYELPAFAQSSGGLMQAPWVTSSTASICWSCQKTSVIIVTDGSPNSEMTFPAAIMPSYADATYKIDANCGPNQTAACNQTSNSRCCSPSDSSSKPPSPLPRVASWLHDNDLHPSDLNNKQSITVSAVSFNLPAGNARTILQATANMSGGQYNNAADGAALASGVAQVVAQISNTATAFGAPAATALTTINAVNTKAFLTRFKPTQKPTWEGHVYEWLLFDEAAAGCNPAKKPDPSDPTQQVICRNKTVSANFNGDTTFDGFNVCTGSFLVDADCDEVVEDSASGKWFKKGSGGVAATMFWDAGEVLSTPTKTGYRTAAEHDDPGNLAPVSSFAPGKTPRNLWAALPDGTMLQLETKNAAQLAPYMNLDQAWCSSMEATAKLCGSSPLPSCPVTTSGDWRTSCAQQVILFARGWDVLDQDADGCAGPGNPSNGANNTIGTTDPTTKQATVVTDGCKIAGASANRGEERDRPNDRDAAGPTNDPPSSVAPSFYKLGDVFHSSPVLVHPPTGEPTCNVGTDNQCVRTLFGFTTNEKYSTGYQTDLDTYSSCKTGGADVDAYRAWRNSAKDRHSAVLVGSNDGFLHAFDAGAGDASAPTDADCVSLGVTDGTGEELWGLVPADLLPRLKDTLLNHQYMVDGNVMVRDIWVDGVTGAGNALDGKKQKNEFRTIAVVSERSGGTQFTALDVTSALDGSSGTPHPTVLWTFPPPLSSDAQFKGQSWSDFSPRPPPIGPVRLKPTSDDRDPQGKGWVEKWVVALNGGYDPALVRGRAVWMVGAWTGSVVWRFTDSDFKSKVVGSGSNTSTSMFPVPAALGLVDLGDPTATRFDSDNFFDTATWGDMGGNLFVARFWDPGDRDSNGIVKNWKAARAFEESRRSDDHQLATNRNEFYYMTSNAYEPQKRALRTQLGAGNREQILEQGQTCAPDNVFGCCQAGCSVSTSSTLDYGVCSSTNTFSCSSSGEMSSGPLTNGCSSGASACVGSGNQFQASASFSLNCGSSAQSTSTGTATCDQNGLCTVAPVGTGHDVTPPNAGTCNNKARFYSVWSYGGLNVAQKAFTTDATKASDWSEAQTFDQNRFTDAASFTGCTYTDKGNCSLIETTQAQVAPTGAVTCADGRAADTCQATVGDPGWFYQYNTGPCASQVACNGNTACTNEKTASGSTVLNACTTWNSFIPLGSGAQSANGTDPCNGATTAQQGANGYASHYVTGIPDLVCNEGANAAQTLLYRAQQRNTIAPPAAPMVRMGVSRTGQVYYSTLQMDPGGAPTNNSLGQRDLASPLYWLEVSRDAHNCRHVSNANCN